jgi:hypothetical protein
MEINLKTIIIIWNTLGMAYAKYGGLTQRSHPASQDWSFSFVRFGEQVRPRTNKKAPLSSTKRPLCPGLDYQDPGFQYLVCIVCEI